MTRFNSSQVVPTGDETTAARVARNSRQVGVWTAVSRVTGFARAATIAAVLGPSYLGNLFLAANLLPNLVFGFLTGSVLVSLIVPALVQSADREGVKAMERVAGGILGVSLLAYGLVAATAVLMGPFLLRLLTLGVEDASTAAAQQRVGLPLLVMLLPQVVLYGIATAGQAVMNTCNRFALAAAAPALENVGVIVTMLAAALLFGPGVTVESIEISNLLLLGLGTTGAVGLHAAVQWFGAARAGVRMRPAAGWRDPEVRRALRGVLPSLGYAGLNMSRFFATLIVANRVPGGVVAFQLGLNFFYLPIAVGARPVGASLLPELTRLWNRGALEQFRQELVSGVSLSLFLTVPATVAYTALSGPLARAVTFGEMATGTGVSLLAASLATLGVGVLGEAAFVIATSASYARNDATTPFISTVALTSLSLLVMASAFVVPRGPLVLATLGFAFSLGNLVGAGILGRRVMAHLPHGGPSWWPAMLRALSASACMLVPALLVTTFLPRALPNRPGGLLVMLLAAAAGSLTYLLVQALFRSPELASLGR